MAFADAALTTLESLRCPIRVELLTAAGEAHPHGGRHCRWLGIRGRVLLVLGKVEAHADVMPPIAESLVKRNTVGEAAEDDLVAAEFPSFFCRVSHERRADPL